MHLDDRHFALDSQKLRNRNSKNLQTMGDFTFWLRLLLSLNFSLSTYLSQKVKWFCWAKHGNYHG